MVLRFIRGFFQLGYIGTIAAVVGIASSVYAASRAGKSGGGSTAPPYYSPAGVGEADQAWLELLRGMQERQRDTEGVVSPLLATSLSLMMGLSPQEMVSAAERAGAQYGQLADISQMYSTLLGTSGTETMRAGREVYEMGRDPQEALRGRTQQRVIEAERASQAARGLGTSPYGAGLESDALRNFNIDWENNLLNRSVAGLNAMTGAGEAGTAQLGASQEFGRQVPIFTQASGAVPFQARQLGAQYPASVGVQYADWMNQAIQGPASGIQSQIIPYLNFGQGAGANYYTAAANNRAFQASQQQNAMRDFIRGLNELGRVDWSKWGGGGNDTQNYQQTWAQEWQPFSDPGYYGPGEY